MPPPPISLDARSLSAGRLAQLIVSVKLRHSARSRRSSRNSTPGSCRPSCKSRSNILLSPHTPHSSHPGLNRLRHLRACREWTRSRRVRRCKGEACPSRSHNRHRCSYVQPCFVPESRPRLGHRSRQPSGAMCRAVFPESRTNGPPHPIAVHPWPHLLSRVG
jgi:hypothetical protein